MKRVRLAAAIVAAPALVAFVLSADPGPTRPARLDAWIRGRLPAEPPADGQGTLVDLRR